MSLGQRQVVDVLAEISYHMIEPVFNQTLATPASPGSPVTITLVATAPPFPLPATTSLYPGARIVVGWHTPTAEEVTVIAVLSATTFTCNLVNSHAAGATVFGATFPTQQPTDPVFTQAEVIDYLAQAQNSFLTKVPLIFQLLPYQEVTIGLPFQTLPSTVIELERVAVESLPATSTFNISTITRSAGVVTAVLSSPVLFDQWTPGLPVLVQAVTNSSFNSVSNQPFTLATVSADGLTLTWPQSGANATSSGGAVSRPVWTRLYESSQEQLAMANPQWYYQAGSTPPTNWFEDRAGVYGWGVAPPPQGNFWMELLASVRGNKMLGMLDKFLIPDCLLQYPKYLVLSWMWEKAGVQRSPTMARFCQSRFDFGVMLADRYLRNIVEKLGQARGGM